MRIALRSLALVAAAALGAPALAQCPLDGTTPTCYVSTTGNDANTGTRTSPFLTIQAAIDQAGPAGTPQTVRVLVGTYHECFSAFFRQQGTDVPVASDIDIVADDFLVSNNRTTTILDGAGVCDIAQAPDFNDAVATLGDGAKLRGFTVRNGGYSGIFALGHATISRNIIEDNVSPDVGGGIYLVTSAAIPNSANFESYVTGTGTHASIDNNTIRNNLAASGGAGAYVTAFATNDFPVDVRIDANIVQDNTAEGNFSDIFSGGLAVFTDSLDATDVSSAVITANTIEGNVASALAGVTSYGGGLLVATYGAGTETIDVRSSNVIRSNQANGGYGGGVSAWAQGWPGGVHNLTLESNDVTANAADLGGGGMYLLTLALDLDTGTETHLTAKSNNVSGNTSVDDETVFGSTGGGGIYAEFFNERSAVSGVTLDVTGNTLRQNVSNGLGGGASLYARSFTEPSDPNAPPGAAPATSTLRFVNNLVVANDAARGASNLQDGGGVFARGVALGNGAVSKLDLGFNTYVGNFVDAGGGGGVALEAIPLADSNAMNGTIQLDVHDSILTGNDGYGVGGLAAPGTFVVARIAYNDLFTNLAGPYSGNLAPTGTVGPANIAVDPRLQATTYVPQLCSPTVDAGDPLVGTRVNNKLTEEAQPNGNRANLGSTGLTPSATITLPDSNGDGIVDGLDILRVAIAFASTSGAGSRYAAGADPDRDGDVDGEDLSYVAAWFGRSCP